MIMMKNKLLWLFTLLPVIVTSVAVRFLPEQIPAHYGIDGAVDRWGSKYESFILPVTVIFMAFMWLLILSRFNKKAQSADEKASAEAKSNLTVLYIAAVCTQALFNIMCYVMLYGSFKKVTTIHAGGFDFGSIVCFLCGLIFLILGNYMPKVKRNYIMGLRTKWSLANDEAWANSNRAGGIMFVVSGVIVMVLSIAFKGFVPAVAMLVLLTIDVILAFVLSYYYYKKSIEK